MLVYDSVGRKIQLYWNDFEENFPECWTEVHPGRKLTSLWDEDSGKDSHTNFQEYSNVEGREMFYNNLMGKYLHENILKREFDWEFFHYGRK